MNIALIFSYNEIEKLTYSDIRLERIQSNIISFDYKTILDAPLSNTDPKTLKELNFVAESTFSRTEADIEQLHKIDRDLDTPFINLLSTYNIEYPQEYINKFYYIVEPILMNIKTYWNRPRPAQLAKLLNIPIDPIVTSTVHTPSYPGGHTTYSRLVANILKHHYPQIEQKKLDNLVYDTARARVMMGVHFPSDNQAGILFADYVFKNLRSKI